MEIELKDLRIDQIIQDNNAQPRAIIDEYVVNEYYEDMQAGNVFPPLIVFQDKDKYYLADGWHRLEAAKLCNSEVISCAVQNGTLRDAILYSCGVNSDHGKRRTNGDKRRAILKLIKDNEWYKWSDREIARQCKVNHETVGKLRKEIHTGDFASTERRFIHPKTNKPTIMDVGNIGKSKQEIQKPELLSLNYQLFVCDITNLSDHVMEKSVDTIITDPPYPKEYIHVYGELAEQAKIVLKPNGILIALAGHPYINVLIDEMSQHLKFHWLGCYYMPSGHHASLAHYNVSVYWKPLLIFVNGEWPNKAFQDVFINDEADKEFHHWGQGVSGFERLVNSFTLPNDTVLDPFVGGGTTAIATLKNGRYFIGSDVSEEEVNKTKERIENAFI